MNILQKLSYRIFQEAFHLVIPFLPYREPEILDSCADFSKVFKKENISSLLIVTDKGIESNCLLKPVEDICKFCNILINCIISSIQRVRSNYISNLFF